MNIPALERHKANRAESLGALGARVEFLLQGEEGVRVHKATEIYDGGVDLGRFDEDGREIYTKSEWKRIGRFVQFQKEHNPKVIEMEQEIVVPKFLDGIDDLSGYAGTLDRVYHMPAYSSRWLNMEEGNYILDFKSGQNNRDPGHLEQVAAYWYGKKDDIDLKGACVLYLNNGTSKGWQLVVLDNAECQKYFQRFLNKLSVWKDNNSDFSVNRDVLPEKFVSPHKEALNSTNS